MVDPSRRTETGPETLNPPDPREVVNSPDFYNGYHNQHLDVDGVNPNQTLLNTHPEVVRRGIRTTDHDSRNLPGEARTNTASSPTGYTSKPRWQTTRHGYKDGPTTNLVSDVVAQEHLFTSLVGAQRHVTDKLKFTKDSGKNKGLKPGENGILTQQEKTTKNEEFGEKSDDRVVADFIIEYLVNAGITPEIDSERLARVFTDHKGSRAVKKLDKHLSKAAMRAHTAYVMRLGKTVTRSLDNPGGDDTNIPVAVQRGRRILPSSWWERRLVRRGGKLQAERYHIGAEQLAFMDTDRDGIDIKSFKGAAKREEERRRKMARHTIPHHMHHNDHAFEDLAFGRRSMHVGIPKTRLKKKVGTPRNASKNLHKAAKRAQNKVAAPSVEDSGSSDSPAQRLHETAEQRMQRMRRQAATRAGR